MSKNKNRRVQTPKARNIEYMKAMQELRRSSAASPQRLKTDYRRKPKHASKEWE